MPCPGTFCVPASTPYSFSLTLQSLNIPKNIITFNCMMDAYGKRGLMNEARQIFDQMKEEGLKPDDVSFSTLIDGYGKTGRHNEAVSFLKEARAQASAKGEKRSLALTHASNALINSFCKYCPYARNTFCREVHPSLCKMQMTVFASHHKDGIVQPC